jgi:hypothetical protein
MIWPLIIIKSILCLAFEGTPLMLPVQQGVEHVEQIRAPASEPVRVERSTSNTPPPQHEVIQAQSARYD